jgi:hypothetical protein
MKDAKRHLQWRQMFAFMLNTTILGGNTVIGKTVLLVKFMGYKTIPA